MIKLIIIIGIVIGLILVYFMFVALLPGFKVQNLPLAGVKATPRTNTVSTASDRKDVCITVKGDAIKAWLYLPDAKDAKVPCIVMANGTGGTKDMLLEDYARRFQAAGMAVLNFDYRCFGGSGGRPRQLIWIPNQLEDYAAAVDFARSLEAIDPQRIALWGTSLSGGHAITVAARDHRIACVVAQCPGVDGRASAKYAFETMGLKHLLRMVVHGQRDWVRGLLGLAPHRIPIVGKPGSIGLLTTPGEWEFFEQFVPESFVNEVCARIVIRADKYRPVNYAGKVRCPVLMQVCEKDEIIPVGSARETEKLLGRNADARYYPIGHFDIYKGEHFERAVEEQIGFLKKHLSTQK
jgi:acetyl esterase/lipase